MKRLCDIVTGLGSTEILAAWSHSHQGLPVREALETLRSCPPGSSGVTLLVDTDKGGSRHVTRRMGKDPEHCAASLLPWRDWARSYVSPAALDAMGEAELVALCLEEMTVYGTSDFEVGQFREAIALLMGPHPATVPAMPVGVAAGYAAERVPVHA